MMTKSGLMREMSDEIANVMGRMVSRPIKIYIKTTL